MFFWSHVVAVKVSKTITVYFDNGSHINVEQKVIAQLKEREEFQMVALDEEDDLVWCYLNRAKVVRVTPAERKDLARVYMTVSGLSFWVADPGNAKELFNLIAGEKE